jgi:hypothetical protein
MMVKERFYVNKTGFEMFDVFRAYGLAFAITGIQSSKVDARISDRGYLYCIDVDGAPSNKPDPELFVDSDDWIRVFGRGKWRKDAKKKPPKPDCEEIFNTKYQKILDLHRDMGYVPHIGYKVKEGRTLYQTFDVSASKGFREAKVGSTYHDGTQLYVDKYSWSIACIGRVFFGVRIARGGRKKGYALTVAPNPDEVLLHEHRQIRKDLDLKRLCGLSPNATLVHYAVKLSLFLAKRRPETKYESIIFNVLQRTGQQPKPSGGGRYSLGLLEKFLNPSIISVGIRVLEKFDEEFELSTIKGIRQDIALALADFLLRPNLENFRTFASLYIRGQIKRKFNPWKKDQLEEILNHVEIA